jgi:hypothetical protein
MKGLLVLLPDLCPQQESYSILKNVFSIKTLCYRNEPVSTARTVVLVQFKQYRRFMTGETDCDADDWCSKTMLASSREILYECTWTKLGTQQRGPRPPSADGGTCSGCSTTAWARSSRAASDTRSCSVFLEARRCPSLAARTCPSGTSSQPSTYT